MLSEEEKQALQVKLSQESRSIPVSVFRCGLSGLEAVTVFLKDTRQWNIRRISSELNRKPSTLYATYTNAKKKLSQEMDVTDFSFAIPVDVFADRRFSVLELIVSHMRDKQDLALPRIATLLGKNYSTVKTAYRRYRKKCL
ncbi:hypothetical protein ACFL3V_03955 [Nanoarchaeota archaeon]